MIEQKDFEYIISLIDGRMEVMRDKKIFITGATGIIGKWWLEFFLYANDKYSLGLSIVAISRSPIEFLSRYPYYCRPEIKFVAGDIRTYVGLGAEHFDFFIHGATDVVAQGGAAEILETCSQGTANALRLAKAMGVSRFLLISSGAVYGKVPDDHGPIGEDFCGLLNHLSPEAAYAQGKRSAELLCLLEAQDAQMQISMARCFAMVGPHLPLDKHFAIGNFIQSALQNEPIEIKGDGTPVRSYLYMADVIARLLLLLLAGRTAVAYNIGGRIPHSISQLAENVLRVLNVQQPIRIANKAVHGAHANTYYPETRLIDTEFNLPPAIGMDEAIVRTANWYRHQIRK